MASALEEKTGLKETKRQRQEVGGFLQQRTPWEACVRGRCWDSARGAGLHGKEQGGGVGGGGGDGRHSRQCSRDRSPKVEVSSGSSRH